MYKCKCCGYVFFEPGQKEEQSCSVPAPFGIGTVQMGGGIFDCCPECESEDYDIIYFDGIHCPYCGEIIDLSCIEDEDNFAIKCPNCNRDIEVLNGELVE